MKKQILLTGISCLLVIHVFSQCLFTYGTNKVSRDEFLTAYNRNIGKVENREASLKEYLELYTKFKLKVMAAKEQKLDTAAQLKYDLMNFRIRLQNDYMIDKEQIFQKVNFKRNPVVKDEFLYLYADSAAFGSRNYVSPPAKQVIFTIAGSPVKMEDWLAFAKDNRLKTNLNNLESNSDLLQKFITKTVTAYYQNHLEEYNPDFTYRMQEFKEGNLLFEIMGKKVWNKSTDDQVALRDFYNANKDHFVWTESAEVILINAKSYAYADYAAENLKTGVYWKKIAEESEGQIQSDSGRYEISQLPVQPGTKLVEGAITPVIRNEKTESAGFIKVLKIYPVNQQRSFEEAKTLVVNEYQKQLEDNWMNELAKKYPVKVNNTVLLSLLK